MMDDTHIADGIAVKLLLAGIVLVGGAVGALGLAPATSQAATVGLADEPVTTAFPINNVTASIDASVFAFPINNVTAMQIPAGILSDVPTVTRGVEPYALALGQDMDPYSLDQDMDPY